jgi:hypothetical protein
MARTPSNHTDPQGRVWRPYSVEFRSQDSAVGHIEGRFSFTIHAVSAEHAHLLVQDLRETAVLAGELVHRST